MENGNGEFRGTTKEAIRNLSESDKILFDKLEKIEERIVDLRVSVAQSGGRWGALTGGLTGIISAIGYFFYQHLCSK